MRVALLRSKPALRWSYEGFFLNEKKEVMTNEAMFKMWGGVPGEANEQSDGICL